jgi:natural product biosynthesis luciferase-like monooxygenase protein
MSNMQDRLAALTPEQRALLEKQMKQRGLKTPEQTEASESKSKAAGREPSALRRRPRRDESKMDFSLFFFSGDGTVEAENKYHLLLESAKYADQNRFSAVWTPERHFQDFGGLYPNPSVMSAALAMITERLQIRSGSVAIPLHHPIRVAEEWALVDNLSNGRVGMCCASGWHPLDFIISPEPTVEKHENRRAIMFENIAKIQRLWAGESVPFQGLDGNTHELRSLPRPIQSELPIWISSQGSPDTFIMAGEIGANILTALVGQTLQDVGKKIQLYREARAKNGFDPDAGIVSVMVHTFLGEDDAIVKEQVRAPLTQYLRTFIAQQDNTEGGYAEITEADKNELVNRSFENYFNTIALLGTPDKCETLIEDLVDLGVNEIACLIDFGVPPETVLDGLQHLNILRERYATSSVPATV